MQALNTEQISIRPESSVYATYRRISYKAWFAIAEFVDNSTQNFFTYEGEISEAEGAPASLDVYISYDRKQGTLSISDNANGMGLDELRRAVQLNKPPTDTSGRSEFGMGLKMAAIWFGHRWRIVTKRLHSDTEYEVMMDVGAIEENNPESVEVLLRSGQDPSLHYTRVEIEDLHRKLPGRTLGRVKEHLQSMYRKDIVTGRINIYWNGELLEWVPGQPYTERLPDGSIREWMKEVHFDVQGYLVQGRAWIQVPGNARNAGLHLFRRGRLIVGGPGEGYKPEEIFAAPNSFMSQRLFGELDLDDWPVTQSKDAFDWTGELEHEFIIKLREQLSEYIRQSREIESPDRGNRPTKADAEIAGDSTRFDLSDASLDEAILIVEEGPEPEEAEPGEEVAEMAALTKEAGSPTYVKVGSEGLPMLKVWWLEDLPESAPYSTFACPQDDEIQLTVNLNHPFVVNVLQRNPEKLALFADMLYVDALVERGARRRGRNLPPSAFRKFKDVFLRRVRSSAKFES